MLKRSSLPKINKSSSSRRHVATIWTTLISDRKDLLIKRWTPKSGLQPEALPRKSKIRTQELQRTSGDQAANNDVGIFVNGEPAKFSPILLRDLCECSSCVDISTKQKLFSTADIPTDIKARAVAQTDNGASILWDQDVAGFDRDHTTELSLEVLKSLSELGRTSPSYDPGVQTLWEADAFRDVQDIDYEAYMQDDAVLFQALKQLHTHGLLFISNVPESEKSVSTLGERIGPIKNTFYGYTWDVRSVPEAKNVAYTAQDLGFHMDLLYMHQPPHLQLLHCIRSSAVGGASLFTDSYKSAEDLFAADRDAFNQLSYHDATFHYNHPNSHLYYQQRPVFEMKPLNLGGYSFKTFSRFIKAFEGELRGTKHHSNRKIKIADWIDAVSWSPPFQGPHALRSLTDLPAGGHVNRVQAANSISRKVNIWHHAAKQYSALLHRPNMIYERLMKPGESVIFDNRRVLHARKAFAVADLGKERWLRGAYLDKDPYVSKLRVLQHQFGDAPEGMIAINAPSGVDYFETAASS